MQKPLHSLEKRILATLASVESASIETVAANSGLSLDQVRRATEWLKTKGFVVSMPQSTSHVALTGDGSSAATRGLPERRLQRLVSEAGGTLDISAARRKFSGTHQEFSAALGRAKQLGWIETKKDGTKAMLKALDSTETSPEEKLIEKLKEGPVGLEELPEGLRVGLDSLHRRPTYVEVRTEKTAIVEITQVGRSAIASAVEVSALDAISPEVLTSGAWRTRPLRAIDVEAPAAPLYLGRKHPVQRLLDEVREIFVVLGFEEVEGPLVQPCFWNFDALFIPQDHPAREMQDTFYVKAGKARSLGSRTVVNRVAETHADGGNTGSRGWGYTWSEEEAKRLVLRTHTTAVTVKYLADHKPHRARVFSVGRVFRNEKVTYKNLVEFHQIEGIAVGPDVALRDMMGLLSEFYRRLGLRRVKFWPSYFPYTEPSLQSVVFAESLGKWVELCGMGIFRPEVTLPIGVKNPVLAWGGGLERLVMLRYGVDDLRTLYQNDLGWLRRVPLRP